MLIQSLVSLPPFLTDFLNSNMSEPAYPSKTNKTFHKCAIMQLLNEHYFDKIEQTEQKNGGSSDMNQFFSLFTISICALATPS